MITQQELNALIAILARAPLTPAEALWLQTLLDRLAQVAQAQVAQEA